MTLRVAMPRSADRCSMAVLASVLSGAIVVGAATARAPLLVLVVALALGLGALVVARPAWAAYLLTGLTPLLAGIDRGRLVPALRPNEALLLLCAAALCARGIWNLRTGDRVRPRIGPIAASLVLMAVCNSIVPLLWMALRDVPITDDDVSYAVVLWKYLALYAVVRAGVRVASQVNRCLWISIASASLVAGIAVLQALDLFGVEGFLDSFYAPFGDTSLVTNNRGSATLGLAAATADLMLFNLALVAALWWRGAARLSLLAPLGALFVAGTLASGQFSAAIGLVVVIIALGLLFRRARLPVLLGLVTLAAAWPLQSVIATRLSGFGRVSGLPESWVGRLENLRNYFWPRLFSDYNFVLGVQPSARVPSPRTLALPWVWIESGYTWLLWGGGLPLLASYILFVALALRYGWRAGRRADLEGVVATGVLVAVLVVAVLMLFDPHLTYRGSGDLLFILLALAAALEARRRDASTDPRTATADLVVRPAGPPRLPHHEHDGRVQR
ncbi:hypothetical protein ACFQH9_28375 [Pseudonocardia lutea]|uniref:O-antigen ligase n=1 Tax=Pseudonocardia lutea TaxID=2172015 RepID=A0ABW1IIB4_9PSEU